MVKLLPRCPGLAIAARGGACYCYFRKGGNDVDKLTFLRAHAVAAVKLCDDADLLDFVIKLLAEEQRRRRGPAAEQPRPL